MITRQKIFAYKVKNILFTICKYLRLCDNHCDGQLRDIGAIGAIGHGHGGAGDCGGCRKRKEHEDFAENEAKFSKQSPAEDSVTYLMRKWASSTETQEERDTVCPPPPPVPAAVLDEVSLQLTANL